MKFKNFMIYFAFILVILASFAVPTVLLMQKNVDYAISVFDDNRSLDVEAEKIYIVKMIKDIAEMDDKNLYFTDNKETEAVACKR